MSSSREKSSSGSSSKKPAKPKTLEEVRIAEQAHYVNSLLTSHAGYLKAIILSLSSAFEVSLTTTAAMIGAMYFMLHLITPAFLLPHLSALTTLIIPVTCTMRSIAFEKDKKKSGDAKDSSQWCLYWVSYCLFEFGRGWITTWAPGCKAVFEVIRTAGLITVGGPWFGYAGLVSYIIFQRYQGADASVHQDQARSLESSKR